ncbi:unnamed protein product, partial [Closterium sp. Naga37s-1]
MAHKNAIDATLFILELHVKGPSQLQQNKVTDLIHISTDRRDDSESVEVSLHFEKILDLEMDTSKAVPGSKSGILCTTLCNDTTKHDVDNHDSSCKAMTTLLEHKGIDLRKDQFHVLQGELERVATMQPKAQWSHEEGLLEYLEKMIGTNKYIDQIKEKSQRLEDLNTKRVGFTERMQLAEREKDQLEERKKAAEDFLLKEAQHTQLNMAAVYLLLREIEHMRKGFITQAADLERENRKPKNNKILSNLREGTSSRGMDRKQSIGKEMKMPLQMLIVNENCKRLTKLTDRRQGESHERIRELESHERIRELEAVQSQFEKNESGVKKALVQLEEVKHRQRACASHSGWARDALKRLMVQLASQIS